MPLSRREILANLRWGVQFLPALAFAPRSLLGDLLFEPDAEVVPAKPVPPNPYRRHGKSSVVMVHGEDPAIMLRQGLEALGGLEPLGLAGKRVLLKPNIVNDRPPPTTTSRAVIAATARLVRKAGAGEVLIADSSGVIRFPTKENLRATGVTALAASLGTQALALEDHPWVRVEPAQAEHLTSLYVSRPVYEADVLINLPVVKTHRFASYSCCLKNLVGIVHPRNRPSVTFLAGSWHERIAEINLAVQPHLHIADATTLMIAGGPTSGTAARADVLLLSGDPVALDVVAVALIRSYGAWSKVAEGSPWSQRQIARAGELGLGATGPDQVEVTALSTAGGTAGFDQLVETVRRDIHTASSRAQRRAEDQGGGGG